MRNLLPRLLAPVALALLAAACGQHGHGSTAALTSLETELGTYQAALNVAPTPAAAQVATDAHQGAVDTALGTLHGCRMGGMMGGNMSGPLAGLDAASRCSHDTCRGMAGEMAAHRSTMGGSGDLATMRTETDRHCAAMRALLGTERTYESGAGMMGGR